jgi:hypothetical protein
MKTHEKQAMAEPRVTRRSTKAMEETKQESQIAVPAPNSFTFAAIETKESKQVETQAPLQAATSVDVAMTDVVKNTESQNLNSSSLMDANFSTINSSKSNEPDYLADDSQDSNSPSQTPYRDAYSPNRMFSPASDSSPISEGSYGDVTPNYGMDLSFNNTDTLGWGYGTGLASEA